jgi:prophage regulatory protein
MTLRDAPLGGDTVISIIRRHEVERRTGLAKSSLYALIDKGQFPRPINLTEGRVGWLVHEIDAWAAERIAARDHPQQEQIERRGRGRPRKALAATPGEAHAMK